jgi:hypothetical protein
VLARGALFSAKSHALAIDDAAQIGQTPRCTGRSHQPQRVHCSPL